MHAYRNGKLIDDACLSERAFIYADGVFETMRARLDRIPLWSLHRQRLKRASQRLFLDIDLDKLEQQLDSILRSNMLEHARVKLIVGRSGNAKGSYLPKESGSDFYISITSFSPRPDGEAIELKSADQPLPNHSSFSGLKLINRLDYIVSAANTRLNDIQELLFLNSSNHVVETMHHNVFSLKADLLSTPDLIGFGVAGVQREHIISKLASSCSLRVELENITLDNLFDSDAVFITNAVDGIVEVSSINGQTIERNDKVHKLSNKLKELYH